MVWLKLNPLKQVSTLNLFAFIDFAKAFFLFKATQVFNMVANGFFAVHQLDGYVVKIITICIWKSNSGLLSTLVSFVICRIRLRIWFKPELVTTNCHKDFVLLIRRQSHCLSNLSNDMILPIFTKLSSTQYKILINNLTLLGHWLISLICLNLNEYSTFPC